MQSRSAGTGNFLKTDTVQLNNLLERISINSSRLPVYDALMLNPQSQSLIKNLRVQFQ